MSIKRRVFEILFQEKEKDLPATIFFVFIMGLIFLNITMGIIETDEHSRVQINTQLGFEDYATDLDDDGNTVKKGGHPHGNGVTDTFFQWFELISVIIFSIEYLLRLWSCTSSERYRGLFAGRLKLAREPLLLVDLIAIAPFYIQLVMPFADLRFVRILRLMRIFRMFRSEGLRASFELLVNVVRLRLKELSMALVIVALLVVLSASLMYSLEHEVNENFHSVPQAMWWAIITVTTIGYGDAFPITTEGKVLGGFIAFLGVCVFALPVGIIGAGFVDEVQKRAEKREEDEQLLEQAKDGDKPDGDDKPPADSATSPAATLPGVACPHCGKSIALHASPTT